MPSCQASTPVALLRSLVKHALLTLSLTLVAFDVWARSGGIAAGGCQGCHGAASHTTSIDVSPATFMPGDTVTVTVTARGAGGNAGLYLTATRGTFVLVGTRLLNGDVVQSTPKTTSGGQAAFQVRWTAPSGAGGAELTAFTVWATRISARAETRRAKQRSSSCSAAPARGTSATSMTTAWAAR